MTMNGNIHVNVWQHTYQCMATYLTMNGNILEEELEVPEDAVRDGLQGDDAKEHGARNVHMFAHEHERAAAELSDQVEQHKKGSEDVATAPGPVHVVALLPPLQPHADTVLDERADEAEARQVRQDMLAMA